jgi:Restriction endonuclease BglII
MLDRLRQRGFEIQFESHAAAILERDFPAALADIEPALLAFDVPITEIIGSGGGETKGTQRLRKALADLGWPFKTYEIRKTINGVPRESISHEMDHVKSFEGGWEGTKDIAIEIEWNNKDPFFDRDLENFKRLHAEGAISVGIVITRATSLQGRMREFVARYAQEQRIISFDDLTRLGIGLTAPQRADLTRRLRRSNDFAASWVSVFVASKFGEASTHWRKLMDRVSRGVGSPCPLLLIGFPAEIVSFQPAEQGAAETVPMEEPISES